MAKRKYSQELFKVRRIHRQWWITRFHPQTDMLEKIESTHTRSQANQYADDYTEKYYVDLYLQQQLADQNTSADFA